MSFFSQKKKSNSQLRSLSETEIQKKLYGTLRPELLERSRSKPVHQPQQQSLSFLNQGATAVKPVQEIPQKSSRDLFDNPEAVRQEKSFVETPETQNFPKVEKNAEKSRLERLAELAEIEKPVKKTPFREDPWKKKSFFPAVNFDGFQKAASGVGVESGKMLAVFFKNLLGIFVVAFAFLLRLGQSLDLRKPAVRRAVYWLAGAAALFSIFMGIHLLNVRREEAMKSPAKITAVKKTPKKVQAEKKSEAALKKQGVIPVKASSDVLSPAAADAAEKKDVSGPSSETPAPAKESETSESQSRTGRYVIQVATFASSADAERVQKTLKQAALPAFVKSLTRPSGRVYYSVFMGRYTNFDEAQTGFEAFRKSDAAKTFQDAFIRTIE